VLFYHLQKSEALPSNLSSTKLFQTYRAALVHFIYLPSSYRWLIYVLRSIFPPKRSYIEHVRYVSLSNPLMALSLSLSLLLFFQWLSALLVAFTAHSFYRNRFEYESSAFTLPISHQLFTDKTFPTEPRSIIQLIT
jgi:hypothetical protein